jgi:hypothetical protein
MAPARKGRKPAKNETAAAMINALGFISTLKAPNAGYPEQYDYVFMNAGYAIGYNGIVAAGHPLPEGIVGYYHAKLLAEALDNTDKTFTMTRRDDGFLEIGSGKYSAIVPAYDAAQVIPTMPDNKMVHVDKPDRMLEAFKVALELTNDTGTIALHGAIMMQGSSLFATNGSILVEIDTDNPLPPVTVPRQFLQAIVKLGKKPHYMGINGVDHSTFTIWYEDGAWLRTNVFGREVWSEQVITTTYDYMNKITEQEPSALPASVWAATKALLPFTDPEFNRLKLRPGRISTTVTNGKCASLDVPELMFTADVNGKHLALLEGIAINWCQIGEDTLGFYSADPAVRCRGVILQLRKLPEETEAPGWGSGAHNEPEAPASEPAPTGWAVSTAVEPPAEENPALAPEAWGRGPSDDLRNDPEFMSQFTDRPVEDFYVEQAYIFTDEDNGLPLEWNSAIQEGFKPSGWLDNLTDQDGGFTSGNN